MIKTIRRFCCSPHSKFYLLNCCSFFYIFICVLCIIGFVYTALFKWCMLIVFADSAQNYVVAFYDRDAGMLICVLHCLIWAIWWDFWAAGFWFHENMQLTSIRYFIVITIFAKKRLFFEKLFYRFLLVTVLSV